MQECRPRKKLQSPPRWGSPELVPFAKLLGPIRSMCHNGDGQIVAILEDYQCFLIDTDGTVTPLNP